MKAIISILISVTITQFALAQLPPNSDSVTMTSLRTNPAVKGSILYASRVAGASCGNFKFEKKTGTTSTFRAVCNKPNESQVDVIVNVESTDDLFFIKSIEFAYAG